MTRWVKLREGHEPLAVNWHEVSTLEGTHGGRETLIGLTSGGSFRVARTVDECIALLDAAARDSAPAPADDWLDDETTGPPPSRRGPGRPKKAHR